MATKLVWGAELYKGHKIDPKKHYGNNIGDLVPLQFLTLDQKTPEWIQAVADYYEYIGWQNVQRKARRIDKNYMMRNNELNKSDYVLNPDVNTFAQVANWMVPDSHTSPIEQFHPLVPNFVDTLRGEFIKRDNRFTVDTIDPYSKAEKFKFKKDQFEQALLSLTMAEKQQTLAEMGITPETDPEAYQQQIQAAQQKMTEIEFEAKNFRTTAAKWAEKAVKIHDRRYNLYEIEPDGFESGLISDSEFWHIDLLEDDFRVELLNPRWCDYQKGSDVKYVSDGDYFLWFQFMSAGDIINKFGRRMKEEDMLKLKDVYMNTANMLIPDASKAMQGAYYDHTKSYRDATDFNPVMNDALLGQELANTYERSGNFVHNMDVDILSPAANRGNHIKTHHQFRVMRLYTRSMYRLGWLTKINRDGSREAPDWVDENYIVTVEPEYDTSVVREKTKDNLLYGEHIDWTWAVQWRHTLKISPNEHHSYWRQFGQKSTDAIYIDGAPVKFQFKGRDNHFDSLPPVEGCNFSYINTKSNSFVDRLAPMQIIFNMCMNRVPRKFIEDYGNKIAIDSRSYQNITLDSSTSGLTPREEYIERLERDPILEYSVKREALENMGQPALPQVLAMSTISDAEGYFRLAQAIKMEAGMMIGITPQRLGQNKASETKYGIEQGITYSETQTEKYFEQHTNLMERVRQRMLDATQYYTTFHENARDVYMNDREENVFLDIEGMDNLLPHYNISLVSRANVRAALQTIAGFLMAENTLPIKPSAKLEALVESSIPKIMTMVKEGELEQEAKERAQFEEEMRVRQEEIKAQNDRVAAQIEAENLRNEQKMQNNVDVATIRAMGGIQTDVDVDGQLDSKENLDTLKLQDMQNKTRISEQANNTKMKIEADKNLVIREKAYLDLQKEKIRQEGALKVAKENKGQ